MLSYICICILKYMFRCIYNTRTMQWCIYNLYYNMRIHYNINILYILQLFVTRHFCKQNSPFLGLFYSNRFFFLNLKRFCVAAGNFSNFFKRSFVCFVWNVTRKLLSVVAFAPLVLFSVPDVIKTGSWQERARFLTISLLLVPEREAVVCIV